jgi:mRNA interferase YafQ
MIRTIKYTARFKRDFKREKKSGRYKATLEQEVLSIVKMLSENTALPLRYSDHQLNGEWKDHRDCHIKPDLILIYRKPDHNSLELVRLGSHSELGL